jgi:uncharacterized protein
MSSAGPVPPPEGEIATTGIPPKPSPLLDFLVGPHGIRAGWRLALYLAMCLAAWLAFRFVLQDWEPHGKAILWADLAGQVCALLSAVIPAFIMARIEKRSFDDYGLPLHSIFGRLFWVGTVWGLVAITILIVAIRGLHGFYFGHMAMHGGRIARFTLFWALFFLLVGLFEEFFVRGYAQFTLTSGVSFWPAALALSATFGAVHLGNSGENWVGGLGAAAIGLFLCFTLRRTGSLWFAVGLHASWDWGESFLYSVPDSGSMVTGHLLKSTLQGPLWLTGGTVGPEASVLLFPLLVLLWLVFDRVYPDIKYPAV